MYTNLIIEFDAVLSPLCLVPSKFEGILGFEFFKTKKCYVKLIPSILLWNKFSTFVLFFLFKYDAVIVKQPSSFSPGNFLNLKLQKNFEKKSPLHILSHIWENVGLLGELDNVEYGNNVE